MNEYKMTPQGRIQLTDEEQAELLAKRAIDTAVIKAEQAAETLRLSKRPKRSQITATQASVASAQSVAELRVAVANLMTLMDNILAFQKVDVDEQN